MAGSPLVSVIVPAYQAERFLAETLASALAQDHPSVEVIVVDDGSCDATAEIAAAAPVRLLRRPHHGVAAARNAGLTAARGTFVTVLDADDLWPVDRLSRQVAHLEAHPEHGIVLGLTQMFLSPGEARPGHWPAFPPGARIPGVAGTMLARRSVFDQVGAFDEGLSVCEDVDWLARVKDAGVGAGVIDHVVLHYRIHAENSSRHTRTNLNVLLGLMRQSVARQRAAAR